MTLPCPSDMDFLWGTNFQLSCAVYLNHFGALSSSYGPNFSSQMRKSCPDLDTTCSASNFEEHRVSKKRNRRAKEKARDAAWRRKRLQVLEVSEFKKLLSNILNFSLYFRENFNLPFNLISNFSIFHSRTLWITSLLLEFSSLFIVNWF